MKLVHLYPKEMNIYGDTGNRIVLEKRMEWRGITFETHLVGVGDMIPKDADIIIGGGGQDASQDIVAKDLMRHKDLLQKLSDDGVGMLMVCGMYQLFGRRFLTSDGIEIKGLGILPVETIGKPGRCIGNISIDSDGVGTLVGYENHSGRTYLDESASAFGRVVDGDGNDGESGYEGCRVHNTIGTYMHGPILSKNPELADAMIKFALERRGLSSKISLLDDTLELKAKNIATTRPR